MVIDEYKAKEIAKKFLGQYHSIIVTHAIFEQDAWSVSVRVGISPQAVRKVRIDAVTGRILGYS